MCYPNGMTNQDETNSLNYIPKRGRRHLGRPHGPPVRITNLGGLCTYLVVRPDSPKSTTAQPTINYQSIAFIIDSSNS